MVPAETPPEAVKALRDAARKGAQDPGFKKTMSKLETPIRYLDAPDFRKFWDQDAKRLSVTVHRVGKVQK